MVLSPPGNSATHRKEFRVGFSQCAGDRPGVHVTQTQSDLLGNVPRPLLSTAERRQPWQPQP